MTLRDGQLLLGGNIDFGLGDDSDDHNISDIDLPLKHSISATSNFAELSEGLGHITKSGKKVRFQHGDKTDILAYDPQDARTGDADAEPILSDAVNLKSDIIDLSQSEHFQFNAEASGASKSRISVEELIERASEINDSVSQNIESMKLFASDAISSSKNFSIPTTSDVHTQLNMESLSNFNLSETDFDDTYKLESTLVNPLKLVPTATRTSTTLDYTDADASDSEGTYSERSRSTGVSIEAAIMEVDLSPETCVEKARELLEVYKNPSNEDLNMMISGAPLYPHNDAPDDLVNMSLETAVDNFRETIKVILELSRRDDFPYDVLHDWDKYHSFVMKNQPSLSYDDFINRLQDKCKFAHEVYQSASYILQLLLLRRESPGQRMTLRHRFQENEVHRVVIAAIRIATKLIEDRVHSHEYFRKVCGISKKLLTRLEVKLLICLKNNRLAINAERMAGSALILQELRMYL